jgi:predicted O-methyltransferase YrrM
MSDPLENNLTVPIERQISEAIENVPGWSELNQLLALHLLAMTVNNASGKMIEVGSWYGRSALAIGMAARKLEKQLICIDLFPKQEDWFENDDGSFSFSVNINGKTHGAYQSQTVWKEPYNRDIKSAYKKYGDPEEAIRKSIDENGLSNYVQPIKSDLEGFLEKEGKDVNFNFAFLDGDHSYESVSKDISLINDRLLPGGWLCFDDAFVSYEGVSAAIRDKVVSCANFGVVQQITRKLFVAMKK